MAPALGSSSEGEKGKEAGVSISSSCPFSFALFSTIFILFLVAITMLVVFVA